MTLIYYDDIFLEHDTGGHPENSRRLEAIMGRLKQIDYIDRLKFLQGKLKPILKSRHKDGI